MEWVEFTAATVEEAKDKALDELRVDTSDAEFEVLEEPRKGLFGRVKGQARVRARVKPAAPRPKTERRDRRKRSSSGDAETRPDRASRPDRATSDGVGDVAPVVVGSSPTDDRGQRSRSSGDRGPSRGPQQGGSDRNARSERSSPNNKDSFMSDPDVRSTRSIEREAAADPEAELAAASGFLQGLVDAFGLQGELSVVIAEDEGRELHVNGQDLGLLIGPKGATLEAIQELTRLAARKAGPARSDTRLRVDIGSYREKRRAALVKFARSIAEQVQASGVQRTLEPMSSVDRKTVHDALSDVEGVSTTSEGEEPRRRVLILPGA